MLKSELCNILRDRMLVNPLLKTSGITEELKWVIENATDQEILLSYIICPDCCKKANNFDDIERVILESVDVNEFIKLTNFTCKHY